MCNFVSHNLLSESSIKTMSHLIKCPDCGKPYMRLFWTTARWHKCTMSKEKISKCCGAIESYFGTCRNCGLIFEPNECKCECHNSKWEQCTMCATHHSKPKECKDEFCSCHTKHKWDSCCSDCKKEPQAWEEEFIKKFECGGGTWGHNVLEGKVYEAVDFIERLLQSEREKIVKKIDEMKKLFNGDDEQEYIIECDGYNQALEDIIKFIKG